jgi:selenide,water dikinase
LKKTMENQPFDLLSTMIEPGGCSAKLNAQELAKLLADIHIPVNENVLVDVSTHDDAGVYRMSDDTALIVTTDFFPPVCSSPSDFGEIAAANALSDVYAMGGKPLLALNLTMFSAKLPQNVLRDILAAGQRKINEAGAFTMGGHTIDDYPPKYGLAVVGTVHPERVITNAAAAPSDVLILTKSIGTGIITTAHKLNLVSAEVYEAAIASMKQLNNFSAEVIQKYGVRAATDVTGFALGGHLLKMMQASGTSAHLDATKVPVFPEVLDLIDDGCLSGAAFKNLDFITPRTSFSPDLPLSLKIMLCDAQTSGGLLICAPADKAEAMLDELRVHYPASAIIGKVTEKQEFDLYV